MTELDIRILVIIACWEIGKFIGNLIANRIKARYQ